MHSDDFRGELFRDRAKAEICGVTLLHDQCYFTLTGLIGHAQCDRTIDLPDGDFLPFEWTGWSIETLDGLIFPINDEGQLCVLEDEKWIGLVEVEDLCAVMGPLSATSFAHSLVLTAERLRKAVEAREIKGAL